MTTRLKTQRKLKSTFTKQLYLRRKKATKSSVIVTLKALTITRVAKNQKLCLRPRLRL